MGSSGPTVANTIKEGLAFPRVLVNPFRAPRKGAQFGEGRHALVVPGLMTGDISTTLLRRTLQSRGFKPQGWRQGINIGADAAKLKALESRIANLHQSSGKKVVLIGWSLGGLYARVLAHRIPQALDMVVSVASPFSGDPRANRAWKLYEAINDHGVENPPFTERLNEKPPVPTLAVWSAVDGVIAPECTRGEDAESDYQLRIDAQHFALGTSRACIDKILFKMAEIDASASAE